MSLRVRGALLVVVILAGLGAGCRSGIFGKRYEYEEDLTLGLDGSATIVVNASIASLVALRGLDLDVNPLARVDREKIRAAYQSSAAEVQPLRSPWMRAGRRFVQIRLKVSDIRRLSEAAPLAWSRYTLTSGSGRHVFGQTVGPSALRSGTLRNYGWDGSEIVAFRLHLPSKIRWHNVRDMDTNETKAPGRGNILAWEQHLADRLDGRPVEMRVEMDSQSILYRTLGLFLGAFVAAVSMIALLIWWTMRKGARERPQGGP